MTSVEQPQLNNAKLKTEAQVIVDAVRRSCVLGTAKIVTFVEDGGAVLSQ